MMERMVVVVVGGKGDGQRVMCGFVVVFGDGGNN